MAVALGVGAVEAALEGPSVGGRGQRSLSKDGGGDHSWLLPPAILFVQSQNISVVNPDVSVVNPDVKVMVCSIRIYKI
ncbi:hypothetical protein CFC21_001039 [Triticum aestivum]|uniref:Uncharacterized protein n=2 Tax=Triticum TaxID=4564 RepID=A0A9R0UT89_TRITD|nr:hypothetical protein CFC21_001039 [Triticum aestivum]VAH02404.1 unnamed protein product [Triticum turgidum subsp. durum]